MTDQTNRGKVPRTLSETFNRYKPIFAAASIMASPVQISPEDKKRYIETMRAVGVRSQEAGEALQRLAKISLGEMAKTSFKGSVCSNMSLENNKDKTI